ncbi:MSHA biogenesis protein MshK [Vibrio bivalvicida]|uniref:MSHA biogenesis protein MshK n=1 Tax=Vibrio bivalvicida TaxID=1276888 RepID=A0ABV4MKS3_9VIBR
MARICLLLLVAGYSFNAFASQDPTAPLGWQNPQHSMATTVKRKSVPKLQSIVCEDKGGCSAIINGEVVLVGEQISDYRVGQIKPETVTLVRDGKQWELKLFSLEVKQ